MPPKDRSGGPGRDRVWMTVVFVLLLLLVALGALRIKIGSRFRNRFDELRAQGYPMSAAELQPRYAIAPDVPNAADLYLDAFSLYVEANDIEKQRLPLGGTAVLRGRTEAMPMAMKRLAQRFLTKNEAALSCLHQAAGIEHCQYPIRSGPGPAQPLSGIQPFRDVALLLCLEAQLHADNGEPNRAAQSLQTALALTQSLPDSSVLNRLVQVTMQMSAVQTLEHILNQTSLADNDLASLSQGIDAFERRRGLRQAFIGERCHGLQGLDQKHPGLLLVRAVGLLQSQVLKYIDRMQAFIDITDQPEHKQTQLCAAIDKANATGGVLTPAVVPAFAGLFEGNNSCLAYCRAARTALALERYYLAHGRWAESIDVLVPAHLASVPKDPFDGQALRFRRLHDGFVVYSVGEDLNDDGGKVLDEDQGGKTRGPDIGLLAKRPR